MPIKPSRREADIASALQLLLARQGDQPLVSGRFSPSHLPDLAPTTWNDLLDDGILEDRGEKPGPLLRFTAQGWLEALEQTGALEQPVVRERAIQMRRALKAHAERNAHYPQPLHVQDLAKEVGLPVGWVKAAIDANLLQAMFPDDTMNATFAANGLLIRIPANFASKRRD